MPDAHQQFALREYIDSVRYFNVRIQAIEKQMLAAKNGWSLEPIVDGLMAMRGVNLVAAMGIVSELGDLSRFSKPSQLMAYLGLVPSEPAVETAVDKGELPKAATVTSGAC